MTEQRHDTTRPGGRYRVNGVLVDAEGAPLAADHTPDEQTDDPLADFPALTAAGFSTVEDVRAASDEQLLAIDGVGAATLKKLRAL